MVLHLTRNIWNNSTPLGLERVGLTVINRFYRLLFMFNPFRVLRRSLSVYKVSKIPQGFNVNNIRRSLVQKASLIKTTPQVLNYINKGDKKFKISLQSF